MTRAKRNITVHLNSAFLEQFTAEALERRTDYLTYPDPEQITVHLSMTDIRLDDFLHSQYEVDGLTSGDPLKLSDLGCRNTQNQPVLAFSQQFIEQIKKLREKNYRPISASVNHIVYWRKEGEEKEVKVVLPEVCFDKII